LSSPNQRLLTGAAIPVFRVVNDFAGSPGSLAWSFCRLAKDNSMGQPIRLDLTGDEALGGSPSPIS